MTTNAKIRLRLGDILHERGIKQNEFAAQTGLSQNTISGLASNRYRQIRLATIVKLCRTLDVQPGDLFQLDL